MVNPQTLPSIQLNLLPMPALAKILRAGLLKLMLTFSLLTISLPQFLNHVNAKQESGLNIDPAIIRVNPQNMPHTMNHAVAIAQHQSY